MGDYFAGFVDEEARALGFTLDAFASVATASQKPAPAQKGTQQSDASMTLISDLIDLPEQVHRGDFVLRLSEGVEHPAETLRRLRRHAAARRGASTTPWLHQGVRCSRRRSKAAYLHGSFGSGKSHFMAVLHLLLKGNARRARHSRARVRRGEAQRLEPRRRKFLLVPYHMIGARSMESAILGGYVEHIRTLHPDAPLPGVYLAERIFRRRRDDCALRWATRPSSPA